MLGIFNIFLIFHYFFILNFYNFFKGRKNNIKIYINNVKNKIDI